MQNKSAVSSNDMVLGWIPWYVPLMSIQRVLDSSVFASTVCHGGRYTILSGPSEDQAVKKDPEVDRTHEEEPGE